MDLAFCNQNPPFCVTSTFHELFEAPCLVKKCVFKVGPGTASAGCPPPQLLVQPCPLMDAQVQVHWGPQCLALPLGLPQSWLSNSDLWLPAPARQLTSAAHHVSVSLTVHQGPDQASASY